MSVSESLTEELVTLRDYIRYAASSFAAAGLWFGHGTATPLDEAAALVMHSLHLPYDLPAVYFDAVLTRPERTKIVNLIERRITERKPLPYLTHEAIFCGLSFYVDERVLIPRSPIAEMIERRFQPWLHEDNVQRILDLCTGCGCIGIACAYHFPGAEVDLTDVSEDALAVARMNMHQHGLDGRVRAIQSNLFDQLPRVKYDLIISNPPYVGRAEWETLPQEYRAEPELALLGGETGVDHAELILRNAGKFLADDGLLVVEVGGSATSLESAYPDIPFTWVEFERGGDGVFALTADELAAAQKLFVN